MKKSELIELLLKHGVTRKFKNGKFGEIQKCKDVNTNGYGYLNLYDDYNEDLNCIHDTRFDIVKIYYGAPKPAKENNISKRFEIFADDGKQVIKDNKQLPRLLDLYKCCVRLNEFVERIAELEKKLVEKDKELEEFRFKERNLFPLVENLEEKVKQDKISFAITELEKVKKYSNEKFEWWENHDWETGVFEKTDVSNAYFDIEAKVDDQIEELKRGK